MNNKKTSKNNNNKNHLRTTTKKHLRITTTKKHLRTTKKTKHLKAEQKGKKSKPKQRAENKHSQQKKNKLITPTEQSPLTQPSHHISQLVCKVSQPVFASTSTHLILQTWHHLKPPNLSFIPISSPRPKRTSRPFRPGPGQKGHGSLFRRHESYGIPSAQFIRLSYHEDFLPWGDAFSRRRQRRSRRRRRRRRRRHRPGRSEKRAEEDSVGGEGSDSSDAAAVAVHLALPISAAGRGAAGRVSARLLQGDLEADGADRIANARHSAGRKPPLARRHAHVRRRRPKPALAGRHAHRRRRRWAW